MCLASVVARKPARWLPRATRRGGPGRSGTSVGSTATTPRSPERSVDGFVITLLRTLDRDEEPLHRGRDQADALDLLGDRPARVRQRVPIGRPERLVDFAV